MRKIILATLFALTCLTSSTYACDDTKLALDKTVSYLNNIGEEPHNIKYGYDLLRMGDILSIKISYSEADEDEYAGYVEFKGKECELIEFEVNLLTPLK